MARERVRYGANAVVFGEGFWALMRLPRLAAVLLVCCWATEWRGLRTATGTGMGWDGRGTEASMGRLDASGSGCDETATGTETRRDEMAMGIGERGPPAVQPSHPEEHYSSAALCFCSRSRSWPAVAVAVEHQVQGEKRTAATGLGCAVRASVHAPPCGNEELGHRLGKAGCRWRLLHQMQKAMTRRWCIAGVWVAWKSGHGAWNMGHGGPWDMGLGLGWATCTRGATTVDNLDKE